MSHTETDIEATPSLLTDFAKITKHTTRHLKEMRQDAIFNDGALPARIKALSATLWAISVRCEPCLVFYVREASKRGTTQDELGEMLAIASTMGGCVGETWALKAFKAYKNISDDEPQPETAADCC